jgi:hypothetical protein
VAKNSVFVYLHISERCPATVVDIDRKSVMFPNASACFSCPELVIIKDLEKKEKFINISVHIIISSEEVGPVH